MSGCIERWEVDGIDFLNLVASVRQKAPVLTEAF